MANTMYTPALDYMLTGGLDWVNDTLKATLVDLADYTPNTATDEYLSNIPAGARVATTTLVNATVSGGVADADDALFSAVTGDESEALVIYKDTGTETSSPLLVYIDDAANLPVTPNGGQIEVVWPAEGIVVLG